MCRGPNDRALQSPIGTVALVILAGCGARTPLDGPSAAPPEAAMAADAAAEPAVACTSALLPGAPTPMRGYCSTRAGLAPANAPASPRVGWTITLPGTTATSDDFEPYEILVDGAGRAYVAVNASPENPDPNGPHLLVALDPDGSVIWTYDLGASFGGLVLAADGSIELLVSGSPTLVRLSSLGSLLGQQDLNLSPPPSAFPGPAQPQPLLAVGHDGSAYVQSPGGTVARFLPDGTTLWTQEGNANYGGSSGSPFGVALGGHDEVMAWLPSGGAVAAIDPTSGGIAWQDQANAVIEGPVVAPDDSVLTLVGFLASNIQLAVFDPNGTALAPIDLGSQLDPEATQFAVAADGTRILVLPQEFAGPAGGTVTTRVQAVAADGTTRWMYSATYPYVFTPYVAQDRFGVFVDPRGTVVVTAGSIFALELSSGDKLWEVAPPNPAVCLEPAVLGAGGSVLAAQCDGTLFVARDGM